MSLHHHVQPVPGESDPFHFETHWLIDASPATVWNEFSDVATWPDWWAGMKAAKDEAWFAQPDTQPSARPGGRPGAHDGLEAGSGSGPGTLPTHAKLRVASPLGPGLNVTMALVTAHEPWRAEVVVGGDLRGTGRWRARPAGTGFGADTHVDFLWCVVTSKPLLRALRPLAAAAHDRVMTAGEAGLRARITESRIRASPGS